MGSISEDSDSSSSAPKFYAQIAYEDPYVQPLILRALSKILPASSYKLISSPSELPSPESPLLQILPYEALDFERLLSSPSTTVANAYVIRKALIRKHYLSTTVSNWLVKNPECRVLKRGFKPGVELEVDYAEFLDEALVEAYELRESWERNAMKEEGEEMEWWILKPGMSDRGMGIRLFKSEEELRGIFEEWEGDEEEEDDDVRSDDAGNRDDENGMGNGQGIITSQLRHFIAQPYIHPPLLLPSGPHAGRKFHIRTYVVCVGALRVFVYKPMLALFAASPYSAPWETSANSAEGLKAHLTNTCLQDSGEREGSVAQFWELSDDLGYGGNWKDAMYAQIQSLTASTFEAAARGMMVHFQPLPNAFEIFGVDFMVGVNSDEDGDGDGDGNGDRNRELTCYLLEVNAFPDFKQTGMEARGVVEGLWEEVVRVGVGPFFGLEKDGLREGDGNRSGEKREMGGSERLDLVLDLDLGRR